jgi:hypothetical protein
MRLTGWLLLLGLVLLPAGLFATPADSTSTSAIPAATDQWLLADHFGERPTAVAARGAQLFVGFGRDLVIMDLTQPEQPRRIGYLPLPERIVSIRALERYLCVTAGERLYGVDALFPATPTLLPQAPPECDGRVLVGDRYQLVSRRDETNPYRFVVDVLDLSRQDTPVVATVEMAGWVEQMIVRDNRLFAAGLTILDKPYLQIVDLTSPAQPAPLGVWAATLGNASRVKIEPGAQHAFVAWTENSRFGGYQWGRMVVLDTSNPERPVQAGSDYVPTGPPLGIALSGNHLYLANDRAGSTLPTEPPPIEEAAGLEIIDVSTPESPQHVSLYRTPAQVHDVAPAGQHLYLAAGELWAADITEPAYPHILGDGPGEGIERVVVEGNYLYTLARGNTLEVWNIATPATPVLAGSLLLAGDARLSSLAVQGSHVYLTAGSDGLVVVDVRDPSAPVPVGHYDQEAGATAVAVQGNYAYVGHEGPTDGLTHTSPSIHILDISDPTLPVPVAIFTMPVYVPGPGYYQDPPRDIVLGEGVALVATGGTGGVTTVEITDLANPRALGSHDTPGYATGLALSHPFLYVADREGGLRVLDVSDPAAISERYHSTAPYAVRVAVVGDSIYVADNQAGLYLYRYARIGPLYLPVVSAN